MALNYAVVQTVTTGRLRFFALIQEINRLLEEKEARLKVARKQPTYPA
jgi:hypothetical protein